jgi:hypothetical protein
MSVLYDEWSGPTDLWGGGLTEICLRPDEASSRAASIVANLRAPAVGWWEGPRLPRAVRTSRSERQLQELVSWSRTFHVLGSCKEARIPAECR